MTCTAISAWADGSLLYYSIFRLSDGYECTSGFTEDTSRANVYVGYMRDRIDAELADPDPWGEKAKEYPCGYMQQRGAA